MDPQTFDLDTFWNWVAGHPNCILRAGTPETVLYDDDGLHWYLGPEGDGRLLVQTISGKRPVGELLIEPEQVTYVEGMTGDAEGEFLFQLIAETASDRVAAYFFVLSHGWEDADVAVSGRVH